MRPFVHDRHIATCRALTPIVPDPAGQAFFGGFAEQMFYVAAGQDISSSSSIMPEITASPPSQNFGFLASSPNGLSSSE
jgi:hypothetical protein